MSKHISDGEAADLERKNFLLEQQLERLRMISENHSLHDQIEAEEKKLKEGGTDPETS